MELNFNVEDLLCGLDKFESKAQIAISIYGETCGKKLETWAKNPPYNEKPERYTEKDIIKFKTMVKKGYIKPKKNNNYGAKYKWRDKSGQARKTISGGMYWQGDKCHVYVAGNTEYFPYLELCNDKQYAVLKPAVDALGPEICSGLNNILEK